MVQRNPVRLTPNLSRIDPPGGIRTPPPPPSRTNGCLVTIAIIGVILAIAKCSSSSGPITAPTPIQDVGNAQTALVTAVADQTLPPVEALSTKSVRRGASRVSIAAVEDLAGEMIYSQNCYAVIGRQFSWAKLDECGGFDIEGGLALGDGRPAGAEKEVAWFDGEAAAGRYLKAATAAGLDGDAADQRLASLQAQVGKRHRSDVKAIPVAPAPADDTDEGAPSDQVEDNAIAAA